MKKINYKGRCEKRTVSKCKDVCRVYNPIQSAYVDQLEKDDDVVSFIILKKHYFHVLYLLHKYKAKETAFQHILSFREYSANL